MNEIVRAERSQVEAYVDEVLPRERFAELGRSMPAHIRPELFQRNLLNAVMINPGLMRHKPSYIYREVSKAAGLGLYLDPQLGEAYLIEAYDFKTKMVLPQLRVGYRGLTKLARQSGVVAHIYAHEVRENDFLECRLGTQKELIHKPNLFSDRGQVIGVYAVAQFGEGIFDFEPMSRDQALKIRDRSDAWKAFTDKKIKSTPWSTDEDEMAKKTVIRRLAKRLPQSPELSAALQIEDAAEGYIADRQPTHRRAPTPTIFTAELVSPDQVVEDAPQAAQGRRKAPSPTAAAHPKPEAIHYDPEATRRRWLETSKAAADENALNEAWEQVVGPIEDQISEPDKQDLIAIYNLRRGELGEGGDP